MIAKSKPKYLLLKKIISYFLFSNLIGFLLRTIFKNKIPLYDSIIYTEDSKFSNKMISKIYFKSYEGAELRFVNKYLNGNSNIIELGASLGIVSSVLAKKMSTTKHKLICIEGNPFLISCLTQNVYKNRESENNIIKNLVLDYSNNSDGFSSFNVADEILISKKGSSLIDKNQFENVNIPKTTLINILNSHCINEYILVCDIEGAEIEILLHDENALLKCSFLIIELHDIFFENYQYLVSDLVQIIVKKYNFEIVDSYDCVYAFMKKK